MTENSNVVSKIELKTWWGLGKSLYVGRNTELTEHKNEAVHYYEDDDAVTALMDRLPFLVVLISKIKRFDREDWYLK